MRSKAISMALLALALGAQVRLSFAELSADLPEEEEPAPITRPVRILIPDVLTNLYTRLDLALADVNAMAGQYGSPCVELLAPAELRKPVTLNYSCTVATTNGDAAAALVARTDAKVTVATNAVLTLSNVAFAASKKPVVKVERGGRLELSGAVDFGVPLDSTAVQTEATNGLFLATAIDSGFALDCADAPGEGLAFGLAQDAAAAASAIKIANARDSNLELRGVAEPGDPVLLKWAAVALPLEESVGYFVTDSIVTNTAARLDRLFEKFESSPNAQREIVLLGHPGPQWTRLVTVGADLLIRGEGEVVIDSIAAAAGLTVTNGTLTISNLVFRGHKGANSVFAVSGAAARPARLVLRDSVVANCERSNGTSGYGGAVHLAGAGCSLLLDGATITNCYANFYGGGVYAGADASVELKGATVVKDNWKGTVGGLQNILQNIYLKSTDPLLKVVGDLSGKKSVGVFYQGSTTACKEGDTFATVGADVADGADSAEAFFSDKDKTGALEAAYDETDKVLKWRTIPADQRGREEDFPEARVKVTSVDDGKVLYYERLKQAIPELTGDAIVELRKDDRSSVDLVITNAVTLCTDLEKVTSGEPCVFRRSAASSIVVKPGASLTVTNLTIYGCLDEAAEPTTYTVPLIEAESAELVLQNGATIAHVRGTGNRKANAVTVWNGSTFRMESGAVIFDSANDYYKAPDRYSVGGGLLLDMSTAYLTGGTVSNCAAWRAGGVYVGNRSTAFVSGDFTVVGNVTIEGSGLESDPPVVLQSDLSVANDSTLVLADVLTGSIGYVEGVNCDTNVFGIVGDDFPGDPAESAKRFTNNRTFSTGTVDSEKKLLVWANDGPVVVALPKLVEGLVYTGNEQTGVVARADFAVTGHIATDAGMHTATASLSAGSVWPDGSSDSLAFDWMIAQAKYDMSGVSFTNATFLVDGKPKSIYVSGELPDGVSVAYEGNEQTTAGVFQVIAHFSGDATNYEPIPDREATMTLVENPDPGPTPPDPPSPDYTVTTNDPSATPLAFSAIRRISEDEWELGVTNLLKDAEYALSFTHDLLTPFTTGQWFTAEFSGPTNMIIKIDDMKPACFWRIHGRTTYVTNWTDTVGP